MYLVTLRRIVNFYDKFGIDSRLRIAWIPDNKVPRSDVRQREL